MYILVSGRMVVQIGKGHRMESDLARFGEDAINDIMIWGGGH